MIPKTSRLLILVLFAILPRVTTAQLYNFQNPGDAERFLHYILMEFGLTPDDITIKPSEDVSNAKAVVEEGKRYIHYNADWLTNLSQVSGEEADWINMGILTHELGHHMKFHPVTFEDSSIELELEADWWSGFALRRLGARLEQALSAVETTAPSFQAGHHPPRKLRRQAVQIFPAVA